MMHDITCIPEQVDQSTPPEPWEFMPDEPPLEICPWWHEECMTGTSSLIAYESELFQRLWLNGER